MQAADLPAVFAVEQQVQPFPWREAHFSDSLAAGHQCWVLTGARDMPCPDINHVREVVFSSQQQPPTATRNGSGSISPCSTDDRSTGERFLSWQSDAPDQILAYAILLPVVDEIELLSIAVAPAWQRRGLGRQYLGWLMAQAHADGMQAMFLEVATGNQPALQLYRRAGFVSIGRRRNYYRAADGRCDDAWVMRCPLLPMNGEGRHD